MSSHWKQHSKQQSEIFNQQVKNFLKPIPKDIQDRMQQIAEQLLLRPQETIVDVGCGTGAMVPFIQQFVPLERIILCDCSQGMLDQARNRYPSCRTLLVDFMEIDKYIEAHSLDVVLFNAVFGNFIDPLAAMAMASKLIKKDGRIVISHPMGRGFVEKLHQQDEQMVPNLLPTKKTWLTNLEQQELELDYFCDEPQLYIARLRKCK
eukprot:jgi/Galph1/3673/GphlegSOOS_G2348.1